MEPNELISGTPTVSDTAGPETMYGFRIQAGTVEHQRFRDGISHIAELHHARRTTGCGDGFLITGPSGVGKTVLVSSYAGYFPPEIRLGMTRIPILTVTVPSSPTAKSLAESILLAFGYPKASRGSSQQKTALIHEFISRCAVELIILDEFHHLYYAPTIQHFRDVTDWLKNLISLAKAAVVACGLSEAEFVVDANEQLSRRFSARFEIAPFNADNQQDFAEFRSLLKLLQGHLPVEFCTPLHEANMALRMHRASYGLIDYVHKVLEGAVSVSARLGIKQIDLDILAAGFRERVWRSVPDRLNPFHEDSYLRPLDRKGEVFYLHVHDLPLGSALARRTTLNTGSKARL